MRSNGLFGLCMSLAFVIGTASTALGQTPEPEPQTRQTTIESAAAEKAKEPLPLRSDHRGEGVHQNRESVQQPDG